MAASSLAASTTASADQETSSRSHLAAMLGGAVAGLFGASYVASADEVANGLHAPHYPWPFDGPLDAYDHGAIRRGFKVGRQAGPSLGWALAGAAWSGCGGREGGRGWGGVQTVPRRRLWVYLCAHGAARMK